jgi:replicative DNA helicase
MEAEQSVLGSMMLSPEAFAAVVEVVKAGDFYRPAHQKTYEAMLAVYGRGQPVDLITVREELQRRKDLELVGGALYLYSLVEEVPSPASATYYAKIVAEHALLRRLIEAASRIMATAYDVPDDPRKAADQAEGLIYAVSRHDEENQVVPMRDLVDESMKALEHAAQRDSAFAGIPTGFDDVDRLLSGLQRSNLIVIAARPGVGKSSFVTNIARNVAVAGHATAMFSLEMSRFEIGMRLLCGDAKVPWDKVRAARMSTEDWTRIVEAAERLHESPLFIVDSGNVTIVDIRAKARRLRAKYGLDLIIVDYMQLMSSHLRVENRQQEIAEISRSLKMLAKELNIPVIAVSQLNRDPERRQDKRPQLSDLRECVPGDTPVSLADGRSVPIRDLVGTTPEVLAVGEGGRIISARSDLVWSVGVRPVLRVTLASGREIRATGRHRLLGATGWRRVDELRPGDRVAIARRLPEPPSPEEWPDLRVALLGHLIGDGSYLNDAPLRYTTASEENSRLVTEAAEREFDARVTRYEGRGKWHQLMISGNGNRWHPAGVNRWLRELGVFGQRSHEKRIPASAFRLSNRQVAMLLRHLWATDGMIHTRRPGSRGGHTVSLATGSRLLAEDVARLLLRFEVVARIHTVPHPHARTRFRVEVSGVDAQRRFLELVGTFGPRVPQAARLWPHIVDTRSNRNVDTLPREVQAQVRAVMKSRGMSRQQLASRRGVRANGEALFAFSPSRRLTAEYAVLLKDESLMAWATSDLFWDRIVEIMSDGVEEVFDLTVPGPSSWIAGTVINHNSGSIEQDSDIVMFIHRNDADDPTVKGRADLIVAKHRNGPTDTVPLTFIPQLTMFRNFAPGG